jgi:hypothetical protein
MHAMRPSVDAVALGSRQQCRVLLHNCIAALAAGRLGQRDGRRTSIWMERRPTSRLASRRSRQGQGKTAPWALPADVGGSGAEDGDDRTSTGVLQGAGGVVVYYLIANWLGFTVTGVKAGSMAAAWQAGLGGSIAVGSKFWLVQSCTGLLSAGYSTTLAGAALPFAAPIAIAHLVRRLVRPRARL